MFLILYIVIFLLVVVLLLKLYTKLTLGVCDSNQDMTGKTVLITGATGGIGKATALDLARRNARILLACRNLKKAEEVKSEIISITGNANVEIKHLDLESFDSVRKCAADVLKTEKRLDVLINNAGIFLNRLELTKDGCEKSMQVNHLSHFLLTLLLIDLLKKSAPSRIINVSSTMYLFGILNIDDMDGQRTNFFLRSFANLYSRSKLANILFTRELAQRLADTGVTVNAAHPGAIKNALLVNFSFSCVPKPFIMLLGKTNEEGAQTSIYLAVHPEVEKTTGKFFYDCKQAKLFGKALDKTMARRLFKESEKIVGTTYQSLEKDGHST